jgi:hypothetical protein
MFEQKGLIGSPITWTNAIALPNAPQKAMRKKGHICAVYQVLDGCLQLLVADSEGNLVVMDPRDVRLDLGAMNMTIQVQQVNGLLQALTAAGDQKAAFFKTQAEEAFKRHDAEALNQIISQMQQAHAANAARQAIP